MELNSWVLLWKCELSLWLTCVFDFIWGISLRCRRPHFHGSELAKQGSFCHAQERAPSACTPCAVSHQLPFWQSCFSHSSYCLLQAFGRIWWMGGEQHNCKLLKIDGDFLCLFAYGKMKTISIFFADVPCIIQDICFCSLFFYLSYDYQNMIYSASFSKKLHFQ